MEATGIIQLCIQVASLLNDRKLFLVFISVKPRYSGTEPPPNRFNIWPGYRWDGVDRSNGFERQYFASLSNKKAIKDISYKWSVEDM